MPNPHFFQKCCHFCWLCFDFSKNVNIFERNEDWATVFLKWKDFTKELKKNAKVLKHTNNCELDDYWKGCAIQWTHISWNLKASKKFKSSSFKNYLALFCVGSSIHLILSRSEFFASYLLWAHLNDGSEKCHMPHNGLERVFFTTALHNYRKRGNLLFVEVDDFFSV